MHLAKMQKGSVGLSGSQLAFPTRFPAILMLMTQDLCLHQPGCYTSHCQLSYSESPWWLQSFLTTLSPSRELSGQLMLLTQGLLTGPTQK